MKRVPVFLSLCLAVLLLCGCVFPLQHVSPDPDPASLLPGAGVVPAPEDLAIPAPGADDASGAAGSPAKQEELPSAPAVIDDPKLAVFWYAMADAEVFSFREQFGPLLEASGLPFREFDAENDRYRQLDQIRDAVSGGWNLLAVQLVDEVIRRADLCFRSEGAGISAEKLAVLRRHGTDRVSVNPQTMSDAVLEAIGRRHSAEDIRKALRLVRETGGFAVNMDLIAGLPTDSVEGFSRTVDAVLELEPENITVHTLSIKRGARLHFGEESLPTDGEVKAMLDYAGAGLRTDGYSPYYLYRQKNMSGGFENTGWTKRGRENLYNICIMEELCSILALGAGGSTKLVRRDGGKNERFVAPKYPAEYIADIDRICRDKDKISRFYGNAVSI